MRILVLVKPVPDPEKYSEIAIDDRGCIVREGVNTIINPSDRNAIEAALKIKETKAAEGKECTVAVMSMAPLFSRDKVVECLAMGADEGFLLSDAAFGGSDTYATSYIISQGIRKAGKLLGGNFDLILAGNESADGATSNVPVQVAEWLGITHISRVCHIEIDGEMVRATKRSEELMLTFEGEDPALLAVTRDINKPRLINAIGIVRARKKPLSVWGVADINADITKTGLEGSPTQTGRLFVSDTGRESAELVSGEKVGPEEAADAILAIMRKAGV